MRTNRYLSLDGERPQHLRLGANSEEWTFTVSED
jgi:hypothetical protein